jgi:molybdopterin synthase sulfur carrier subunit
MSIKVRIPTPLQKLTNNQVEVFCDGKNIGELIDNLDKQYSGIKNRLCDENGKLRRFINFFVNDKDIRFLQGTETELKDGDEVSIIPAIAGGELFNDKCSTFNEKSFNDKWFNFQKLKVYNNATEITVAIYDLTKKFPKEEL